MVTIFTTPTCAPCRVAKNRLTAAGVTFEAIDLTTEPAVLQELKARLKQDHIQTPLFEFRGELFDLTALQRIITEAKVDG